VITIVRKKVKKSIPEAQVEEGKDVQILKGGEKR